MTTCIGATVCCAKLLREWTGRGDSEHREGIYKTEEKEADQQTNGWALPSLSLSNAKDQYTANVC